MKASLACEAQLAPSILGFFVGLVSALEHRPQGAMEEGGVDIIPHDIVVPISRRRAAREDSLDPAASRVLSLRRPLYGCRGLARVPGVQIGFERGVGQVGTGPGDFFAAPNGANAQRGQWLRPTGSFCLGMSELSRPKVRRLTCQCRVLSKPTGKHRPFFRRVTRDNARCRR